MGFILIIVGLIGLAILWPLILLVYLICLVYLIWFWIAFLNNREI